MAEFPSRWDFSNWTYLTEMSCSPGEMNAIHEYGIKVERRARDTVATAQDHRDTTDMNDDRVEASDREGAPAEESSALPSSGASLFAHGSSEKSGVVPKQQPHPMQITDLEDQQFVLMEGSRKMEKQDQEVEQQEQQVMVV